MSEAFLEVATVLGLGALMLLLRWMDRVDDRLKKLEAARSPSAGPEGK